MLTYSFTNLKNESLYTHLYQCIRQDIIDGKLISGEKLPSKRSFAKNLGVSTITIENAYAQLLSEGYIESEPYRGYYVAQIEGLYQIREVKKRQTPEVREKEETCRYDFTPNGVDLKSFPHNAWRKLSKEILLDDEVELFRLGDPQGELSFRKVICDYLYQARGVKCDPHQIIVGAGNDYLLMMLCSVIGRNHVIAVENPAYKQAYRLFSSQSYPVEPI